jgi:hypothetical protein
MNTYSPVAPMKKVGNNRRVTIHNVVGLLQTRAIIQACHEMTSTNIERRQHRSKHTCGVLRTVLISYVADEFLASQLQHAIE